VPLKIKFEFWSLPALNCNFVTTLKQFVRFTPAFQQMPEFFAVKAELA
jgi:hypothetical protein